MLLSIIKVLAAASLVSASAPFRAQPFEQLKQRREATSSSLQVDLGYSVYEGVYNETMGLNSWEGIRFAAPPTGSLRWQAPQTPIVNRSQIIQADSFGSQCPQSGAEPIQPKGILASEDCLFLNVYSPPNATNLPVLVWIHGGGYGLGNGQQILYEIINTNGNNFIGVTIQYRLGAFGFLSSDEVFRFGTVNAGILDQTFALQWVQSYIGQFGGNASQVTIAGVSAGGGSVMLQDMAYGGTLGESLFVNTIAASPYLPMQWGYADFVPSQSYYAFASAAGCFPGTAYGSSHTTIFDCLVAADTTTLQEASFNVSASGTYGTFGFLPVTDGVFIQQTPSQQLLKKQVNGRNLLAGNNANEGPLFTPRNISTEAALVSWLQVTFPLMTNDDLAKVLLYYPSTNASDGNCIDFATLGYTGPSALNESNLACGQQQRAYNIYAETTFVCPSYWMAEAYSDKGRTSYKYQYSVLPALHGTDMTGELGPAAPYQGPAFEKAFMTIWGNFITQNNPSISIALANGNSSTNNTAADGLADWPPFTNYAPLQVNLNQTGGVLVTIPEFPLNAFDPVQAYVEPGLMNDFAIHNAYTWDFQLNASDPVQAYVEPGLMNDFSIHNAYTWEAGRGYRCDFWRSVGSIVPE